MKRVYIFAIGLMFMALPALAASVDRSAALSSLNILRENRNLASLRYSTALEKSARRHAEDMVRNGFVSHTGSDGSDAGARLVRGGYSWCAYAENIAAGLSSQGEVMKAWYKSRDHRKNLLNRHVSEFALVRAANDIWVMVLARPGC